MLFHYTRRLQQAKKVLDKNNGKKRDENITFLFDFMMSDSVAMHLHWNVFFRQR